MAVDWWLARSIDGESEISVMSVDAGCININKNACSCSARMYHNQTHESSGGQTRPDATMTRMNASVMNLNILLTSVLWLSVSCFLNFSLVLKIYSLVEALKSLELYPVYH